MTVATLTRTARVAVYARISRDRTGRNLGVDRQLAECRGELSAIPGAVVVAELADNDLSGYKRTKPRPGFDELVALIRSGAVDVVLAWHIDRLTRRLIELAEFIELCQRHGVTIHTKIAGVFDPNNPSEVMRIQIVGSVAEYESAVKSERIKSKHHELAGAGMTHGGIRRFGYDHDMTMREEEAAIVRELAGRLLNGESLAACARWLNSSGVETVTAEARRAKGEPVAPWTGPNLRHMMLRPHFAGLRVHRGEVVGRGSWVPVFDEATHEALRLKLGDPERRTSYSNARVYLLAGLALCGECGAKLRGRKGGNGPDERDRSYTCAKCGGVHRNATDVDERVTDWIVERLGRSDARGMLADDSAAVELAELTSKRRDVGARADGLAEKWATGELSDDDYDRRRAALTAASDRLDAAIASASERVAAPTRALSGLTGPDPVEVFAELPLGRKRAVIDLLCSVTVERAARKGAAFDPAAVVIAPK